jgi:membrane protease YdiL (CAAX protease family)
MQPRLPLVALWVAVAFTGTSSVGLTLWRFGDTLGAGGAAITALAMFAPMLATLVVQLVAGEPVLRGVGARPRANRWLLMGALAGLAVPVGATLIGLLFPGVRYDPSVDGMIARLAPLLDPEMQAQARAQIEALPIHPALLALPQAVLAGCTINALFAFGEEIGWRGWLWRELRGSAETPRFWTANAVIGTIWGLWHAPLILMGHNYPEHRIEGVFLFTLVCVLLSPAFGWVRERSGTVWAAAFAHGTMNAAAGLTLMVTTGGSDLLVGVAGLAGVLTLLVLNAVVWLDLRRASLG